MRQIKFTSGDFVPEGETGDADAVLDPNDPLYEMQRLAGIPAKPLFTEYKGQAGSNISVTGDEKGQLMKKHNIKPGTEDWFKLWFSLPYMTGERPIDKSKN
jgi:hypothetical protein